MDTQHHELLARFESVVWPWYALHVRTRQEASIASVLKEKGYECFLPSYQSRRRWTDRTKHIHLPLFPGYFFCRFEVHKRLPILMTPGVLQIVGIGRIPVPVEDSEIAALQRIVNSGMQSQPWPFLHIGQKVRISHGALDGLEGILLAANKPQRLVVSVTLLSRSVAVEIDEDWAEPVSSSASPYSQPIKLTQVENLA
jgi:transcription antitermination factor NusG